ncbi:MAG: tetratricopeptide repeat protein [Candidatus Krumholzibacteria bacterium]|nr:tetratricopeptide repeat protein [Candidatus Krumholzibacteria bacterium]
MKEDTFVTTMINAWEYVVRHQSAFFIGLIAVIVIVAGSLWMSGARSRTRTEARTQYAEALAAFRNGDLKTAEEMFKIITERYGNLEEGAYASYLAGKCALEDGRNTHAIEMFEGYLDSAGKHPFFRDAAMEGLAVAWENERDYAKAAEYYVGLADGAKTNSFMEAVYLRRAVDVLKLAAQRDKAVELLERLEELATGTEKRDIEIEINALRG